jgi:putative heme iron utilization protein
MERVEKSKAMIQAFKERHPTAAYVLFEDFVAYKFRPVDRVRFIAGFGEMSWVRGAAFDEAKPDPVASDATATKNAISHMNSDHADANVLMVNAFAKPKLPEPAISATLLSVDRYGMDLLAISNDGKRLARVPFEKILSSSKEVKEAIISLTKAAKSKL